MIGVSTIVLIVSGVYLALGYYYEQGFMMNTWINGVYCTGKNVEEVNKELLNLSEAPFLSITDNSGREYRVSAEEFNFNIDFTTGLQEIFEKQNNQNWTEAILQHDQIDLQPNIDLDTQAVIAYVKELEFYKEDCNVSGTLEIILSEEGYILADTRRPQLDSERLFAYIEHLFADETYLAQGFADGMYQVNITDVDCYKNLSLTEEQQKIMDQWMNLQTYVYSGIIYNMGDEMLSISGKIASSFILTDEQGNVLFDENDQPLINDEAIDAFINSLAEEYNTWKGELVFQSTAGEEKIIPYVNYGTEIDIKKESAYLREAFREKRIEVHIPEYIHEGYARGKNDIGDTYIEVDMGNQKLYAYLNGELLVETDIVTGNMKNKTSTPEGVVYVYAKQRNRTLRGPGYAAYVKYWMPVKGGVGLHDASWRSKFGGEIYKKDGSHGCINIPKAIMPDIYENFEIGTPVIMFY